MNFAEQGTTGRGKRGRERHQVSDPNPLPSSDISLELMTTAEVAALVRRTPRTIRNWTRDGVLVPAKLPGPRLFRRADVERIIGLDL
jgi:hypothetical protein